MIFCMQISEKLIALVICILVISRDEKIICETAQFSISLIIKEPNHEQLHNLIYSPLCTSL